MKHGLSLLILLALLLSVAACGGGDEAPAAPASEAPAAATQAVAQQQPAAPAAPAATSVPPTATPVPPTATPELSEEEVALTEDQLAALEKLESYRLVVAFSSKGTSAAGEPIDDMAEIITEYTRDPEARRMVMNFVDNTDPSADQGAMESFQIGNDMYMFAGEDVGWMRVSTEESPFADPELSMITSGNIFSNLEEMRRVRPDQRIGGIDSRHYQFNEQVLGKVFGEDVGDVTATGDVWIAKDGGFVTKYVLTIEVAGGNGGIFDPNLASGVIEMSFELQDVNSDITIELPEEAAAGVNLAGFDGAFPMPEGASIKAASANFAMIESDAPAAEVLAFYEEALAALGWAKDEQGSMSMGDMASLAFTKAGVQLSLMVSQDSDTGKTQIMASAQ
jgi:predicted small lipoprotein YifL